MVLRETEDVGEAGLPGIRGRSTDTVAGATGARTGKSEAGGGRSGEGQERSRAPPPSRPRGRELGRAQGSQAGTSRGQINGGGSGLPSARAHGRPREALLPLRLETPRPHVPRRARRDRGHRSLSPGCRQISNKVHFRYQAVPHI